MNRVPSQSANPSRAMLLLFPALLAMACLIDLRTSQDFAPVAILLIGGALVAGFVQTMQGLWSNRHAADQPAIGIAIGVAFRVAIGLFVIACMIFAAMWATGV